MNAGLPYEIVGIVYYVLFLLMGRKRYAHRYSPHSRVLTLVAAIVLVACVPLHYAATGLGVTLMLVLAAAALISTAIDTRRKGA